MIKEILSCTKGYKKTTILTPILVIFEVAFETLIPFLMALIVDNGMNPNITEAVFLGTTYGKAQYVTIIGLVMIGCAGLSLLFGGLAGRTVAIAGSGFAKNMRSKMLGKIENFSSSNIDKFSTAALITRCSTDINNTQMAFMQTIRVIVRSPLMLIMSTIMAFGVNSDIAIVFLVSIPVLTIAMGVLFKFAYPRFTIMLTKTDKMNSVVQENLRAIREVKAFVREEHEEDKFNFSAEEVKNAQKRAEKLMVLTNPISQFVMYGTILAIVFISGGKIIEGSMQAGSLTSLITYATQILMSLMMICFSAVLLVISSASAKRITEVLDEKIDIVGADSDYTVENGNINFCDVDFSYSNNKDNLTLSGLNLDIKQGETIGIIGGTGSGKTSFVQLIPRFYDCLSGKVMVSGRDVREYNLRALRDGVSMVLQKNVLFSGTIADNIRWGDEHATDEEVEEVCRIAQAHDFVMSFPNGYQTDLGQGGVNVSGGQKQRLCIARALLKKPKILILDDSTSAVDTATDSKIRAKLREYSKDMTVIIIAQRIASIEDADKIVVLKDGKIDAIGNHKELIKTNEIYREVFNSQKQGVE